ncbi:MAG: flavoprotein, partial [Actinobacteria bacterium]|nr:flavoprotein [Actinomycetota bacterium]
GILNEAIGLELPIIVAPYAKPSLAAHPAFSVSLEKLNGWGVNVLSNEAIRVKDVDDKSAPRFSWRPVIEAVIRVL